jgi:hypothetical protein
MNSSSEGLLEELKRIKNLSNQLCTMHAILRDRYNARSAWLTSLNIIASTWIIATVFIEPAIGKKLNPTNLDNTIFYGLLSIAIFILTLLQMISRFPECAASHQNALKAYANIKAECTNVLAQPTFKVDEYTKISRLYAFVGENVQPIPDSLFNKLKQAHKKKVAISRYLDDHPNTNISLIKLILWLRDNFHLLRKLDC